jgi:DNA/RNA-binding domain of Phe-tRNA-synthetase-like protein
MSAEIPGGPQPFGPPNPTMVEIDAKLRGHLCLGVVRAEGVAVRAEAPDVWAAMDQVAAALRARYAGKAPAEMVELQPARELYRRTGEDPTKLRPSSEALLRRILRGEALYRINSLVDLCNLCALEFLLPIGLYDADRITGPVLIRLGIQGEGYDSLGKGVYAVTGRLALFDTHGPFGSPTNDSRRTAITEETRRCLMVIFGPGNYAAARMDGHAKAATVRLREFAQPALVKTVVLGGR